MVLNREHLHTLLEAKTLTQADATPAIIYLATEQTPLTVTRAEFRQAVQDHAAALHQLGIRAKDLVIIAHVQNLESIYCFWGAMWLGAIPSMFPTLTEKLDPHKYAESMALLVHHSKAKAILTTDEFAPQMRELAECAVYSSADLQSQSPLPIEPYAPQADEIAFLQHSSGTTGLQKGVALAHQAVLNQLAHYSTTLGLTADDVIVSWLPLYHDMGLIAGFLLPLVQGIPLVLMSPFDWVSHPAMLLHALDEYKGTFCWLPNFAYNHCARRIRQRQLEGLDLSNVRAFINCSEPVHLSSHELFYERFGAFGVRRDQLAVSYAMAENTFAVTQTPLNTPPTLDTIHRTHLQTERRAEPVAQDDPEALTIVSCGPTIMGTQVQVVDEAQHVLGERQVGEIAIHSDCMLTGYYQRPDLNPFTPEGWYLTGDMGYVANGEVYIIGRKKDLIITGGKNVYPQDLEAIVNTIPGLKPGRNVVFGVPDEREGTELIAIVAECDIEDEAQRHEIVRAIRRRVAEETTVTVTYITLVDAQWMHKTSSGKIARAANRVKWLQEFQPEDNHG